ncbi:MAG: class I SAM-dependent methyltransferase [Acidimicrobiales bacterium]
MGAGGGTGASALRAEELSKRWRLDLESWAIPPEILASSPESPWVLPRQLFTRRAELRLEAPSSPSFARAWEALEPPGSVLDVGTGAGAACLPLAPRATSITAVDSDQQLLDVLGASARRLGADVRAIHGRWPEVAQEVEPAEIVTCHHVLYNVADIGPFLIELTNHARRRVVVEMTAVHPLTFLNPLWERFWGIIRPRVPRAVDMLALLEASGLEPSHEAWTPEAEPEYESFEDFVEVTRRRLCLEKSRSDELASALRELGPEGDHLGELRSSGSEIFTIWWPGHA